MNPPKLPDIRLILVVFVVFVDVTVESHWVFDGNHSLTFNQDGSFIELRPDWPLTKPRSVSFMFRTLLPHALLMYHSVVSKQASVANYEMYLELENARLKVLHVFGNNHESLPIGHALNKDRWHTVNLNVDPLSGYISIDLDGSFLETHLGSLQAHKSYGLTNSSNIESVLYFGGLDPNNNLWNRQYSYTRFLGCIGDVKLKVENILLQDLNVHNFSEIDRGCKSKCDASSCRFGGKCVNLYDRTACDCFNSKHEGSRCNDDALSTITLRGYSYISYKIFDWDDKVHSDFSRISITFRTMYDDSVLFYGSGQNPVRNYIAASLKNHTLHFTINFGDGETVAQLGSIIIDNWWHTFTVVHHGRTIYLDLDGDKREIQIKDPLHYLHLDPLFYVGGVPDRVKTGLNTKNHFVGTIRQVFFNIISILERLKMNDPEIFFHGNFPPEFGYVKVNTMPVTFPFKQSTISIRQGSIDSIDLVFGFKTNQSNAILATADVLFGGNQTGHWELGLEDGYAKFSLFLPGDPDVYEVVNDGLKLGDNVWHRVDLKYYLDDVTLKVDTRLTTKAKFVSNMRFGRIINAGGRSTKPDLGFIGCFREIYVENSHVDIRSVLKAGDYQGEVTMDNCQLVDPCQRPGQCEHGGQCYVKSEKIICNCTGTGYRGKTCHFSMYKRTCEELYLVGYREQGTYMIDIDGNGPHPPAPVACDIDPSGIIMTSVHHNMDSVQMVRGDDYESFYFDIVYRHFTPAMLQTLITHSKNCTQLLRYECHKAPLGMRTLTWFRSSYSEDNIYSFGGRTIGSCPCGETKSCGNTTHLCNCDINDGEHRNDTVELHDPELLGITKMFFLKPQNMAEDSGGQMILGPLQCIEMDTQQYVITFRTANSYLEVPGWRTGDLAFSFRTSNKKAILLYQPSHQENNYFRVLLLNETELLFEYTVEGKKLRMQISSDKPLNSGEWQQVWVDYDPHHVRFTINMDSKMIDLAKDEEFGPFDGPLYIGGAPAKFHSKSPVSAGFVGCFRGLVMNEEIVNIYYYLSSRTPQVVEGCKPSCSPNKCKNNATCHEFWGWYRCECVNPLAHFGNHCEKNLNNNGITFVTGTANSVRLYEGSDDSAPPFLTENILLNIRTYAKSGLILYAHDHFNNFVQLHIENDDELVFTFNSQRELVHGIVKFPELTRGQAIQILIERKDEFTRVTAGNHVTVIHEPLLLIDKYRQNPWREGEELELVKPPRPPVESKPYLQYFIGGIMQNVETNVPGFVGCLTGLRIGTKDIDLLKIVDMNPGNPAFRKGCQMQCDTQPCSNGGYCIEDWKNKQRTCNCTYTSYIGSSCSEERSGSFNGHSLIKYNFVPLGAIYQVVELKIAFATEQTPNQSSILLCVNSKVDERNYIVVALMPDGRIKFEEDDGTGKVIQLIATNDEGTFVDGRRHWVYYVRHDDHINIYIDGVERETNITEFDYFVNEYGGDDRDVVILGGIDFQDNRFSDYINFTGCLSTVTVKIDDFNIYPLETAFGYNAGTERLVVKGQLAQIGVCPMGRSTQSEATTPSPINLTMYVGPEWRAPPLVRVKFDLSPHPGRNDWDIAEASAKRVALGMGIFLLVILAGLGVYLWRVDWKDKQYRYEEGLANPDSITFKGKRRKKPQADGIKAVSFQRMANSVRMDNGQKHETTPLKNPGKTTPSTDRSLSNTPLKRQSSQELEWDPAADNEELLVGETFGSNPNQPVSIALPEKTSLTPPPYDEAVRNHPLRMPAVVSPLFLNGQYRTYNNPLSYLGGPRMPRNNYVANRASVLSLD